MSSGKMSLGSRMLRMLWKKQSSYLSVSRKSSQVVVSLGRVFSFTVLQELVKPFWLRPVPPRQKVLSSPFPHQIWWASTSARAKSSLRHSSTLLERKNPQSSSSMRLTLCVAIVLMERTKHPEESRLNFWFRCKVSVMMILVFWS